MVTLSNELQPLKASDPISVTESGIFTLHMAELGMVTLANELQPLKTLDPISVTESGIVTLANELQPLKAHGRVGNGHACQ